MIHVCHQGTTRVNDRDQALQAAQDALDVSLRKARLEQSAHHEAVAAITDAQTLRLQVLHDELAPVVRSRRESSEFIELALIQGDPPRLWIDLTSYVTMAPDPRTYRLVQDTREGSQALFETRNRAEMLSRVTDFIAHRTIVRQRELPANIATKAVPAGRYSTAALFLAWLTGLSFGVLALFVAGVLLS